MNLPELKTAVRAIFDGNHENANHWVKQNFGNLTRKQTWQDAYDRLSESVATKADQAKAWAMETVDQSVEAAAGYAWSKVAEIVDDVDKAAKYIQDFNRDEAVHLAFTGTAMITRLAEQSIELMVIAWVFCWFFYQEVRQSGAVQKTLDRMAELENPPLWEQVKIMDCEHDVWGYDQLRDRRLASGWLIAA